MSTADAAQAARTVSALYEAALDDAAWADGLAALREFMDGSHPAIAFRRSGSARYDAICPETDVSWRRTIAEYSEAHNLLWRAQRRRPAGRLFVDVELVGRDELERSIFYNEITLPMGDHSTLHVNLVAEPTSAAYFCIARGRGQAAFDAADMARFRVVMPAFTRAARALVQRRHDPADNQAATIRVTQDAKPVEVAGAAWRTIPDGQLLRLSDGRIGLADEDEERRLRRAIFDACAANRGESGPDREEMAVHAADGSLAGIVTVAPCMDGRHSRDRIAIVHWQPMRAAPDLYLASRLQRLFGLTPREAELAVSFGATASLREAGAALSIGRNTARSHIQRIMEKTETHSQAELVRLLTLIGGRPS